MSKLKARQSSRTCAFCNNPANTFEHLWPDWARESLPEKGPYIAPVIQQAQADTIENQKPSKARQAGLRSFRLRVVCKRCNNGWMSEQETESKPVLDRLRLGKPIKIDESNRHYICRWMFLKTVVMDNRTANAKVIPKEDAIRFREKGVIPEYFELWISRCGEEPWGLTFSQYTTSLPGFRFLYRQTGLQNFRVFAIGFGDLYLYVIINRSKVLDIDHGAFPPGTPLHPDAAQSIDWPLPAIRSSDATKYAVEWKAKLENPTFASVLRKAAVDHGIVSLEDALLERDESIRLGYLNADGSWPKP